MIPAPAPQPVPAFITPADPAAIRPQFTLDRLDLASALARLHWVVTRAEVERAAQAQAPLARAA